MDDQVTQGKLRELLTYDPSTGVFTRRVKTSNRATVGKKLGTTDSRGYHQIRVLGRLYLAHRLAWMYTYGEWPAGQVDHINRDKVDNRASNLRVVTHSENSQNTGLRSNNTSGHKGVTWVESKQRWIAQIVHQKHIFLGAFIDQYEAVVARKTAEVLLYTKIQRAKP